MHPLRVRRSIWALFGLVIGVALLVPVLDFSLQWQAPVVAHIAIEPAHPAIGMPVRLVVTLRSRFLDQARQSHLVVTADMLTMSMSFPTLSIPTDSSGSQFQTPLSFSMSGPWQVNLHLAMPAHASWDQHLLVQVQSGEVMASQKGDS